MFLMFLFTCVLTIAFVYLAIKELEIQNYMGAIFWIIWVSITMWVYLPQMLKYKLEAQKDTNTQTTQITSNAKVSK